MIELVDQSDPTKLRYRCTDCLQAVSSSPSRAPDGNVWAPIPESPNMGRWSKHECNPAALAAAQAPAAKPKRAKAPPEPVVATPIARRPGRPRKTPVAE